MAEGQSSEMISDHSYVLLEFTATSHGYLVLVDLTCSVDLHQCLLFVLRTPGTLLHASVLTISSTFEFIFN